MPRAATIARKTKETDLRLTVDLDGGGEAKVETGIPFFDHMLETLAKHGALALEVTCKGDLHIDQHHTVEDTGIALGSAIDEALARSVVDLSGRSYLHWNVALDQGPRSAMDVSVLEGFFKAVADGIRANVHIDLLTGRDFHHGAEAVFKSFARALRQAVAIDPRVVGVPSTKGTL
jgi:imidazoleglycerol-phosphate dehydratase